MVNKSSIRSFLNFLDMICLAINSHLVMINLTYILINFDI